MDKIDSSQAEGLCLSELPPGDELMVETEGRTYQLLYLGNQEALISGHPEFCPEPVLVTIPGSTWGGSMIKTDFLIPGMHLEVWLPDGRTITTSRIVEIRTLQPTFPRAFSGNGLVH